MVLVLCKNGDDKQVSTLWSLGCGPPAVFQVPVVGGGHVSGAGKEEMPFKEEGAEDSGPGCEYQEESVASACVCV